LYFGWTGKHFSLRKKKIKHQQLKVKQNEVSGGGRKNGRNRENGDKE
jgi:hypothetical protein